MGINILEDLISEDPEFLWKPNAEIQRILSDKGQKVNLSQIARLRKTHGINQQQLLVRRRKEREAFRKQASFAPQEPVDEPPWVDDKPEIPEIPEDAWVFQAPSERDDQQIPSEIDLRLQRMEDGLQAIMNVINEKKAIPDEEPPFDDEPFPDDDVPFDEETPSSGNNGSKTMPEITLAMPEPPKGKKKGAQTNIVFNPVQAAILQFVGQTMVVPNTPALIYGYFCARKYGFVGNVAEFLQEVIDGYFYEFKGINYYEEVQGWVDKDEFALEQMEATATDYQGGTHGNSNR